jgi:NADPH-dependent glutamate synthase beta subunit-like oxidoreductase/dihydroorotate dehydrogenase/Pyruvate/2-oxoacid:ferredoxin oxidoreductase delta subunit
LPVSALGMKTAQPFLTEAQLNDELNRCISCEEKPCQAACPADCSPADFIMAARGGAKSDIRRSAAMILGANPLGGVCGATCPDTFCMRACSRRMFDRPIEIPAVQAAIVERAKRHGLRIPSPLPRNGMKVAVIGAGPAGLAAAGVLAQRGYRVTVFEKRRQLGGMMNLIPGFRLPRAIVRTDVAFVRRLGAIDVRRETAVAKPAKLLGRYGAVIVSAGLAEPVRLGIPGEEHVVPWQKFLEQRGRPRVAGKRVAILGGGAVAADCATTAARRGAASVELVYRRRMRDMPVTAYERRMLLEHGVEISTCLRRVAVGAPAGRGGGLRRARPPLPRGLAPRPGNFVVSAKEPPVLREFDVVVSAVGNRAALPTDAAPGVFYAGDIILGSSTVVESVASGKNAAREADAFLCGEEVPRIADRAKSRVPLSPESPLPVPLETDFFGRRILSPLLLSAAPHTDGYIQMRSAYAAGWAGAVMKTAFDNVPIHIPADYMFVLGRSTYGNCDNVSGHSLDRVCREVERLVGSFPDRLTMASTGGPVTGCDEGDCAFWQSNTRKLEDAGAMGVEYSLSCPQGGDGTNGDLVSQNAELTAKIVGWVMETGNPDVPKLFKLTGAVTAIQPIVRAIQEVLARHPGKKAGVTLANSFPSLAFRPSAGRRWDEGVVIGMSGEGVLPISNLTLAKVAGMGLTVSGNGGAMTYRDAANFLALGAGTVQFCTAVMKYGLGYVGELHSGLSHLMEERGLGSVAELVGCTLPGPIADFASLPARKRIPTLSAALCTHCGNCERCPYQAVALDGRGLPEFDAALCVGCSLCAQKCFAGALAMRPRSAVEAAAFAEG